MKRLAGVIGAAIGVGLLAPQALAAEGGNFSLKPGEAKQIVIAATARELRICNDVASGGRMSVVLGSHTPLMLGPGTCADDMGDRILATNQGDSPATGTWRAIYAPSGDHQKMPTSRDDPVSQRGVDFFFGEASVREGIAGEGSSRGEGGKPNR